MKKSILIVITCVLLNFSLLSGKTNAKILESTENIQSNIHFERPTNGAFGELRMGAISSLSKSLSTILLDQEGNILYSAIIDDEYIRVSSLTSNGLINWETDLYLPRFVVYPGKRVLTNFSLGLNLDGNLYILGELDGSTKIYAINIKNGSVTWEKQYSNYYYASLRSSGGINLLGDNKVISLKTDGEENIFLKNQYNVSSGLSYFGNTKKFQFGNGNIYSYDFRKESNMFVYDENGKLTNRIISFQNRMNNIIILDDFSVFTCLGDSTFKEKYTYNYFDKSGDFRWEREFSSNNFFSIKSNLYYYEQNKIVKIDLETGIDEFSYKNEDTTFNAYYNVPDNWAINILTNDYIVLYNQWEIIILQPSNLEVVSKINTKEAEQKYYEKNTLSWHSYGPPTVDLSKGRIYKFLNVNDGTSFLPFSLVGFEIPGYDSIGHWSTKYFSRLMNLDIVQGFDDGSVKPDKLISKEEFIVILFRALAIPVQKFSISSFEDVDSQRWSSDYIETALRIGVIENINNSFSPEDIITREEMASMVAKLLISLNDLQISQDIASSHENIFIYLVLEKGIMSGFEDQTFRPNESATRAQAASVICNVLDYVSSQSQFAQ